MINQKIELDSDYANFLQSNEKKKLQIAILTSASTLRHFLKYKNIFDIQFIVSIRY